MKLLCQVLYGTQRVKPFLLQNGFDVFNALDLMQNEPILEDLKFGIGDGNLNYYIYNWKCPTIAPNKVNTYVPLLLISHHLLIKTFTIMLFVKQLRFVILNHCK